MAVTPGAWSIASINNRLVLECDVVLTSTPNDCYTLKTPPELDSTKPWTLMVNTAAVTVDGSAAPVDIIAGYANDFALAGDGAPTVTSGSIVYADAIDDVKSTQVNFNVLPGLAAARVQSTLGGVSGYGDVGTAPFYIINIDGATSLSDVTVHFVILQ